MSIYRRYTQSEVKQRLDFGRQVIIKCTTFATLLNASSRFVQMVKFFSRKSDSVRHMPITANIILQW